MFMLRLNDGKKIILAKFDHCHTLCEINSFWSFKCILSTSFEYVTNILKMYMKSHVGEIKPKAQCELL